MTIITKADAYVMYEQNRFDDIMPFEADFGEDFIEYLSMNGYEVVDDDSFIIDALT